MHLLRMEPSSVADMTRSIDRFRREIRHCSECNNLSDAERCPVCEDPKRDRATICVVEQVADVLSIEHTQQYRGLYHVAGAGRIISPMQGTAPSDLKIDLLIDRIRAGGVERGDSGDLHLGRGRDDALLPDEPPAGVPRSENHLPSRAASGSATNWSMSTS